MTPLACTSMPLFSILLNQIVRNICKMFSIMVRLCGMRYLFIFVTQGRILFSTKNKKGFKQNIKKSFLVEMAIRTTNTYLILTWKFSGTLGCPKSVILYCIILYCIILYVSIRNTGDYYHLNFPMFFFYLELHEMLY